MKIHLAIIINIMKFKKIEITDLNTFKEFYKNNTELSCETTFVNFLLWQKAYGNMFCLSGGQLFVKNGKKGAESFRLPFGGDLEKGVDKLKNHCGKLPVFWSEDCERFREFREKYCDIYNFYESREDFEYIYKSEALSKLAGKKYHSKRNHISAFSKKYAWETVEICSENIDDVMLCAKKWYKSRNGLSDFYLNCEEQGIRLILENMEALSVKGIAIYVEKAVVAFVIGSKISEKAFNIHIEKALDDFPGAYTVINREFAKLLTDYEYINREDDMGLDGLRQSKLSYKPEILLKKYFCIPKISDMTECKQLYHQTFSDDEEFENELFKNCFSYCKILKKEAKTVSMFFLLPCEINGQKCEYLYGAATAFDERGKGYMSELIKSSIGSNPIFLRPANEGLISFYEKLGFKRLKADTLKHSLTIKPTENFKKLQKHQENDFEEYTLMAINYDTNDTIGFNLSLN